MKSSSKKRNLEGTNLTNENSFVVLDNYEIANLTSDMGIVIQDFDFDKVDMMKDLELARHNLDNKSELVKDPNTSQSDEVVNEDNMLLLEWTNAVSEEENLF